MLYLISAPPRTGKTLKMIEIIFKHLNDGRFVYTNIVGINIPGVFTFSSGIDNPHDWRDLPNGSVVIYDEAHEHPAFAERNLIADKNKMARVRDIALSLTLHGHFGFDIYMITQSPHLLCREVLASVGTHYIMRRKFGFDMATIFEYAEARTTFSKATAKEALNKTFWKYPKHLYKYYVSSEQHNIKKTFPLKYLLLFLGVPLLLFYYGYHKSISSGSGFFGVFNKKEQEQVQDTKPPEVPTLQPQDKTKEITNICAKPENKHLDVCTSIAPQNATSNQSAKINDEQMQVVNDYNINDPYAFEPSVSYQITDKPVISGCISYDNQCKCYTQQGTPLKLSKSDCKRYLSGDKPFNYFATAKNDYSTTSYQPQQIQQNTQSVEPKSRVINAGNNASHFQTETTNLVGVTSIK